MNTREAMKTTLMFLFELLEDKGIKFDKEKTKNAVEIMHDDNLFMDELMEFFDEHIEIFAENYDL